MSIEPWPGTAMPMAIEKPEIATPSHVMVVMLTCITSAHAAVASMTGVWLVCCGRRDELGNLEFDREDAVRVHPSQPAVSHARPGHLPARPSSLLAPSLQFGGGGGVRGCGPMWHVGSRARA